MAFIDQANKAFNKLKTGFYSAMSRTKHFFNVLLDYIPFVHNRNLELLKYSLSRSAHNDVAVVCELLEIPRVRHDAEHFDYIRIIQTAASNGNLEHVVKLLEIPFIERIAHFSSNEALKKALGFSYINVAEGINHVAVAAKLLTIPAVRSIAHIDDNHFLLSALVHSYTPESSAVVATLLEIDAVKNLLEGVSGSIAINLAKKNGYDEIEKRLLEMPDVRNAAIGRGRTNFIGFLHSNSGYDAVLKQVRERYASFNASGARERQHTSPSFNI